MTEVLPALHGYPIHKRPTFATIQQIARSGRSVGAAQQQLPLWEFETTYEILRDPTQNISPHSWLSGYTEYRDLLTAFLNANAQFGFFYFEDLSDNSRLEQGLGTGDGVETDFLFVRTITFGSLTYTEPVGGVNLDHSIVVYVDGVAVPQPGNWNISSDNRFLVFNSAPAPGAIVQASFYFYYLCRFIVDSADFEEFMTGRWANRSLRFRSVNRIGMAGLLSGSASWLPLTPPPVPPPPSTTPPSVDADAHGRFGFFGGEGNTINFLTDGGTDTLTTNFSNELIVLVVAMTKNIGASVAEVSSVTSSSGLVFTRRARVTALQNSGAFQQYQGLEIWTAPAFNILVGENITVNFDANVSYAFISAVSIKDASLSSPIDSGVSPVPTAASIDGAGGSVNYTTTNAYDLLLWITQGIGVANNSTPPAGFTGGLLNFCARSFGFGNIYGRLFTQTVTSLQVGQTVNVVERAVGAFVAIRN